MELVQTAPVGDSVWASKEASRAKNTALLQPNAAAADELFKKVKRPSPTPAAKMTKHRKMRGNPAAASAAVPNANSEFRKRCHAKSDAKHGIEKGEEHHEQQYFMKCKNM